MTDRAPRVGWPLALLGVGLLACLGLLVGLGQVFRLEAREALAGVTARKAALDGYAGLQVRALLRGAATSAHSQQDASRRDVLLSDDGLFLAAAGTVLVPTPPPGPKAPVPEPSSPAQERAALIQALSPSLERSRLQRGIRAVLAHQQAYLLPPSEEVPLTLQLLEAVGNGVSPELARALLRDGVKDADGRLVIEGAMRRVLRQSDSMDVPHRASLCLRIEAAASRLGVRSDDFSARCALRHGELPPIEVPAGSWLWRGEATWFLDSDGVEVRGVKVAPDALAAEVTTTLRTLRLAPADGVVAVPPLALRTLQSLEAMSFEVASASWGQATKDIETRLVLKGSLLLGAGALATTTAALWVLAQRRKARFVDLKAGFVAAVSHELRTPLASVQLLAETLERKLDGDPRAKDYPRRIVHEAERLHWLVENILSFNRLERGRWSPERREVALAPLVERLRDELQRYPGAHVVLGTQSLEHAHAFADAALLELLLRNLMHNACTYNARDPVELRLEAAADSKGLTLRLTDNGVGIPPEARERIFEEFERLPGERGRGGPGSGLGLALCRGIARAHGGTLTLEHSSSDGSTFALHLPEPK